MKKRTEQESEQVEEIGGVVVRAYVSRELAVSSVSSVTGRSNPSFSGTLDLQPFVCCLPVNLPPFYLYKRSFLQLDI
jgi:hypothetical protein